MLNEVLTRAVKVLDTLRAFSIEKEYFYFDPLVNFVEDDEVVLEWWLSTKKLSLYIDLEYIEYFKTWGMTQIHGHVESPEGLEELWEWLSADATKRFDLPVAKRLTNASKELEG